MAVLATEMTLDSIVTVTSMAMYVPRFMYWINSFCRDWVAVCCIHALSRFTSTLLVYPLGYG